MDGDALRCDIFCRVIDNLGDAGVGWRLAVGLAVEQGWRVRLWIDDPAPLDGLAPDWRNGPVEVGRYEAAADPADVVIEAFACDPPAGYVAAMAARTSPPAWINLEYLSAEHWVEDCHTRPSPHPTLPLVKHFFFPGFTAATGGLIREAGYDARRTGFDAGAFRREFALPPAQDGETVVSLFAYADAPLAELMGQMASSARPLLLLLPGGDPALRRRDGMLTAWPLPFLPQRRYDELLWFCDLNFVRGEDSFVRAQWAARPFVWQIYRQDGDAHLRKLAAFLDRYGPPPATQAFWHAWNGTGRLDWAACQDELEQAGETAADWARGLRPRGQLLENLASFCRSRLK